MRLDRLNRLIRDGKRVEGSWELSPRHELRYRRDGPREEVLLSGDLLSAGPDDLTFRLREVREDQDPRLREMSLRGRWQADDLNRLTFRVDSARGSRNVLTLEGGWEVGSDHSILYRFERKDLKRKSTLVHFLRFDGVWGIGEDRRLTYTLDADSGSAFRFRGTFQTDSIRRKKGALRYQLGAEAGGRQGRLRTVVLFGKWKLSRDLALEFEVPYAGGRRQTIAFGAVYTWRDGASLSARLTTPRGGPLGVELVLHRGFLRGQGEAFIRLSRSLKESAAEAGVRVRW